MAIVDAGRAAHEVVRFQSETASAGLTINLFWIIVAALNFLVFFAVLYLVVLRPIGATLRERRVRIAQGIRDADQARIELERSSATAAEEIAAARREARAIADRAERVAQETREVEIAATRAEIERIRVRATAEIEAEKSRAMADLRAEVADLAISAAGRVVRESMDGERQRRLVREFLVETETPGATA